ncbi:MAG: 2-succinyl-5-enolpyruvyl-6-hydroxy-3-cyclohexene-1-carboxylic-acid synthase [Acidobacteria bacterium]|jgi:2-succinyl-5-enolpyruvyl-6-hydroxy-3-cyclohexene-1-carboxylate synthase|nr:2-succinyl-5-enolpyruvyl-6-hydroxy-3-cyclohexene-1-carboxylic-acid synthase [Acidobacteriota bacterium]
MPDGPANLAGAWARLLVDGLAEAGVTRAVVSPGSRSTPLVLALAGHPAIETTVVLDERDAAFHALGRAKATGLPALALCTSGSAGSHYLPAAIEAATARVPLLLLTADRPPHAHLRDAPQTVQQSGMFGPFARAVFDLGPPDPRPAALRALRHAAALAAARTRFPEPGPVQLNAPFDKPLEPQPPNAADDELAAAIEQAGRGAGARFELPEGGPGERAQDALAAACAAARRGVIVAGPLPAWDTRARRAAGRLAAALGWPLLADAASQLRFGPLGDAGPDSRAGRVDLAWLEPRARARFRPDFVLQLGGVPAGRGYERLVAGEPELPRAVITRYGVADPFAPATLVVNADPAATLEALAARAAAFAPADPAWLAGWRALEAAAERALAEQAGDRDAPLGEAAAVRTALAALADGDALALSNSLPVRAVDLFAAADRRELAVFAQRGANGIDGLVAGAAGFAAASGRRTLLLIGDLAFQHGLGGLAVARACPVPLAIVVLDNGGGRLFEMLPLADGGVSPALFERFFLAPQALDAAAAAAAFGVPHAAAATPRELDRALAAALARPGATVVTGRIAGAGAAAAWRALAARVAELLDR